MENGPFICVICPISTSIQFDELPESYVQFPMATNDQRLSLKQHQTFNTTKFHEHAIIKIPKLTENQQKTLFLSPKLGHNVTQVTGLREVHLKDVRVESTIDLRRA